MKCFIFQVVIRGKHEIILADQVRFSQQSKTYFGVEIEN